MKTFRHFRHALALLLVSVLLAGCNALPGENLQVEELLRAPRLSGDYGAVQTALNDWLGESAQLKYPMQGELLSPFLLQDLDGDGQQDAAVLYTTAQSTNVCIAILQRDDTGAWQVRQSVEGLGFAIPINDAIKVAQELLENGYVTGRPYLGITYLAVTDAQTASQLGVNAYGVYVVDVVQGGPADKAGLKTGDRIVSIDGTEIAQKDDLGTLMQKHAAGDTLSITIARDGQMQTVNVTLGEKTASNS